MLRLLLPLLIWRAVLVASESLLRVGLEDLGSKAARRALLDTGVLLIDAPDPARIDALAALPHCDAKWTRKQMFDGSQRRTVGAQNLGVAPCGGFNATRRTFTAIAQELAANLGVSDYASGTLEHWHVFDGPADGDTMPLHVDKGLLLVMAPGLIVGPEAPWKISAPHVRLPTGEVVLPQLDAQTLVVLAGAALSSWLKVGTAAPHAVVLRLQEGEQRAWYGMMTLPAPTQVVDGVRFSEFFEPPAADSSVNAFLASLLGDNLRAPGDNSGAPCTTGSGTPGIHCWSQCAPLKYESSCPPHDAIKEPGYDGPCMWLADGDLACGQEAKCWERVETNGTWVPSKPATDNSPMDYSTGPLCPKVNATCQDFYAPCLKACDQRVAHSECYYSMGNTGPVCARCICTDGSDKTASMPMQCSSKTCSYPTGQGGCPSTLVSLVV